MKIDLGGGRIKKPGYTSVDVVLGDITADITQGIPLDDESVSSLYSHHCIEHLPEEKIAFVLSECFRILKPGHEFDLTVPDFDYAVENVRLFDEENHRHMEWYGMIFGTPSLGMPEVHKTLFTQKKLSLQLEEAGFSIGEFDYPLWYGRNLHVIARKP